MPDIERKGVTLTEALQESAAVAPIARAMLYAYELWHPSLTEPLRWVDDKADLLATLEADAPRNPGAEVEFMLCPIDAQRPEESDTAAAPRLAMGRLDTARDSADALEPWELIERVYASDDTSRPAMLPPRTMELTSMQIAGPAGSFEAAFDDDNGEAVPAIRFTRKEHPGLQR
jgi:hypothetical protein